MARLTDYPQQKIDFPAQLHGTDRLTRRFVSQSSFWDVEWLERWDGAKRLFITFAVARPTQDWKGAALMRAFGGVDFELASKTGNWRGLRDSIEDFLARVWRESRELDSSMAAYCASNLWG
jgi:hypothetical protein